MREDQLNPKAPLSQRTAGALLRLNASLLPRGGGENSFPRRRNMVHALLFGCPVDSPLGKGCLVNINFKVVQQDHFGLL
jgi:hypothetical protein